MTDDITKATCPGCDDPAGEVSWQTAPGQAVCVNEDCPINTWDARKPVNLDVTHPDSDRRWIVLYPEDYHNVMLDGDDRVALLIDGEQALEVWRLASEVLNDTGMADLAEPLAELRAIIDEVNG